MRIVRSGLSANIIVADEPAERSADVVLAGESGVLDQQAYFACTDFAVDGEEDKLYDIDFWLRSAGDVLKVYRVRVHKEPRAPCSTAGTSTRATPS